MSVSRAVAVVLVLSAGWNASAAPPVSGEEKGRAAASVAPAPAVASANEPRVVEVAAIHALVLPMKGSYAQHSEAFGRLAAFLAAKGATPQGAPFGIYYSDPSVEEAQLVWEAGLPVAQGVVAEPPFVIKDIPAGRAAVHVHTGPYEELANAWPTFVQWVLANGYFPAGAAMQLFQGDPQHPRLEMRMPVHGK